MATTTKATPTIASDELVTLFFNRMGAFDTLKPQHNVKDSFSNLVGGVLKVVSVDRGKISCILHVKAPILLMGYCRTVTGICMEVRFRLWLRGLQLVVLERSWGKTKISSLENLASLIYLLLHIM
ncbi:hypothetical protein BUALT_Bualt19G0012200 [Buddleja alternifolia]|uniref:Uncharacterized protein n=1 Tax=Buddleja alternifolia TaxID=168488 RepID=A0AAV6W8R0_9LAMI|nr:hypothetical protein BUALT_Bualt19G0012200 [Buddleja alternifolia]